jgi:hypothetical protein
MLAVLTVAALILGMVGVLLDLLILAKQFHGEDVERRHWENQARFDELLVKLEQLQTGELTELLDLLKQPPKFVQPPAPYIEVD